MSGKPLYNANDGLTGRDGGPYLDEEEARLAEQRRARVEGREPDYDNPPATAGIQLNTADRMIHTVEVNRPSQQHTFTDEAERMFAAARDSDNLLTQRSEIPEAAFAEPKAEDEPEPLKSDSALADEDSGEDHTVRTVPNADATDDDDETLGLDFGNDHK